MLSHTLSFFGMFFLFYVITYFSGVGIAAYLEDERTHSKWILSIFCGLFSIISIGSILFSLGFSLYSTLPFMLGGLLVLNLSIIYFLKKPLLVKPDVWQVLSFSIALISFCIALLPIFIAQRWTPIGPCGDQMIWSSWTRFLEKNSLPVLLSYPINPAMAHEVWLNSFSRFGFHVLHGMADLLLNWKAHFSFPIVSAFSISLLPLASSYICDDFFRTRRSFAFLAQLLFLGNYLFMWEHLDSRAPQVLLLSALPITIVLTARALERRGWKSRILASIALVGYVCIYQEMLSFYVIFCFLLLLLTLLFQRNKVKYYAIELAFIALISTIFLIPEIPKLLSVFSIAKDSVSTNSPGNVYSFLSFADLFGIGGMYVLSEHISLPFFFPYFKAIIIPILSVITLLGIWKSEKRLCLAALAVGGIFLGVYFRAVHIFPYGYYKIVLNYSWIIIIGLTLGLEYISSKVTLFLLLPYFLMLYSYQYYAVFTSAKKHTPNFPAVLQTSDFIKDNIPPSTPIMLRGEAHDVHRVWMYYFLKDYNVRLSEYSSYFRNPEFPFYRNSITEPYVLTYRPEDHDSQYWAKGKIWENVRYFIYEKKQDVLSHTFLKNSPNLELYNEIIIEFDKKQLTINSWEDKKILSASIKDYNRSNNTLFDYVGMSAIQHEQPHEISKSVFVSGNWITLFGYFPKNINETGIKISDDSSSISMPILSKPFSFRITSQSSMALKPFIQIRKNPPIENMLSKIYPRVLPRSDGYLCTGGYGLEGSVRWLKKKALIVFPSAKGTLVFSAIIPLGSLAKAPLITLDFAGRRLDSFFPKEENIHREYTIFSKMGEALTITSDSSFVPDDVNHLGDCRELALVLKGCRIRTK